MPRDQKTILAGAEGQLDWVPQEAGGLRFLLFWFVSGFFEIPFLVDFVTPDMWQGLVVRDLIGHVAASLVWFFFEPRGRQGWLGYWHQWSRFFIFISLMFPFLGWLIVFVLYWTIYPETRPQVDLTEDQLFAVKPTVSDLEIDPYLSKRERMLHEMDFVPLADILEGPDESLKRGAIEKLTELKTPEGIALLLKYRSHPSAEIRFYVTSSLSRIKNDFDEQLEAAKQEMQKNVLSVSQRIFLAKSYLRYIDTRLLDQATLNAYEREAIYHLEFAIQTPYASQEVYDLLIRIYGNQREWAKILELVEKIRAKYGILTSPQQEMNITALFRLGRYRDYLNSLEQIKDDPGITAPWRALCQWWGIVK